MVFPLLNFVDNYFRGWLFRGCLIHLLEYLRQSQDRKNSLPLWRLCLLYFHMDCRVWLFYESHWNYSPVECTEEENVFYWWKSSFVDFLSFTVASDCFVSDEKIFNSNVFCAIYLIMGIVCFRCFRCRWKCVVEYWTCKYDFYCGCSILATVRKFHFHYVEAFSVPPENCVR